ncbi:DUF7575 domain-containing protein [Natronolimnohabitans innermongolicus]|uniref:DUF7575 domain-containing protein n=1 Tax=Natronolimnohabitans innermongolicus JCM 12255 TaxID=1227499 RepID=L9WRV5_9EURY|nr:hypothetical protein [Natronolimnohabitans innermongolicus]ELY51013.1 hypothetical protein C493_18556 [Natronolimnohabitans innermongolicus JCM 12255]
MAQQQTPKNPWLAAGLTLLVTGLGQLYLRRWMRAAAWIALLALTGWLFVPGTALADPAAASFVDLAPLFIVTGLSGFDAYAVARTHNLSLEVRAEERCSSCRGELEQGLSFCPWCAEDLSQTSPPEGDSTADAATTTDDR